MMKRSTMKGILLAGLSSVLAACSATSGPSGNTSGAGASGSGVGGAGAGGSGGDPFGGVGPGPSSSSSGAGGDESCAGEKSEAELVPLDLYIMLDSSGSMLETTLLGPTKWDAVKQALTGFFTDPQSAEIGAGLQYFPQRNEGVPEVCSTDDQCNGHGPCLFKICQNEYRLQNITTPCDADSDCPFLDRCVELGACSMSGTGCMPAGANCGSGEGTCTAITESFCFETFSCEAGDYAMPNVAIAPIGATSTPLVASMNARQPEGGTPTSAALAGAIEQARAHAAENPRRKVVAVLATDGLPSSCAPVDAAGIAQIAAAGRSGSPSISTFVIGVFALSDIFTAQPALNQIAAAGGTSQAFVIDTSRNVTQEFLAALNAIRGKSLACEYQIPTPGAGQTIDFGKVNVEHTPEGASSANTIYYVENAASCSQANGGWHYDVEPSRGTPTKIVLCPSTCTLFQQGGAVDIRVGCETEQLPR